MENPDERDIAIRLMRQQRFTEALPIFKLLIRDNPGDWSLFYMVGQCYRFTNNIQEAIYALKNAADLNPGAPEVLLALGIAYQLGDDHETAISTLEHAIRLDPKLFYAYNSIGLTYKKIGEYRKALEWYSKAAEAIVSTVTEEVHGDTEKCFREELIGGEKSLVVLPYAFEKVREKLRSDPMYAIINNNIGVCYIDLETKRRRKRPSRNQLSLFQTVTIIPIHIEIWNL